MITLEGLNYQEDMGAENPGPDGEWGKNVDDPLEDAITLEEPNSHEARGFEDRDLGERLGGEIQELHAPQPPPPEVQKACRSRRTRRTTEGSTRRTQSRAGAYRPSGTKSAN